MKHTFAMLTIVPALVAGCAPVTHGDTAMPHRCRAAAAARLVGHVAPGDGEVSRRTGASTVRRIAPGDMVTQDYRPDRVTLAIAPDGTVVSATCG